MFSGGAAVDWKNTGGWKTGDNDVIVATWTSTGRGECIAWSNDKGRTFTEYEGNPIIKHKGRDPKPIWYTYAEGEKPLSPAAKKLGGHWVIAVYDEDKEHGRNIALYTSTDLKKWDLQSKLPGYFECAELYPLPVDGNAEDTRWVIFAADAKYAIGNFDGRTFTPEHEGKHQLHWGPYYASQLFSDAPDGRRIQIGWARIAMPGMPFNQTFTIPTELSLRTTEDGVRMFGEPVKEVEKIHARKHQAANKPLAEGKNVKLATSGDLFDIRATFEVGDAKRLGLIIDGKEAFSYDAAAKRCNGAPLKPVDGKITVQILIDRPMIETFVNDGRMIITAPYSNDLDITAVEAFAEGANARLLSLDVHELNASWK
jgi:fructan beta-fructosidase